MPWSNNDTNKTLQSVAKRSRKDMDTHGELLKKLIRRKKLTQEQAAEMLGFSRPKLARLFSKEQIDEVTREEIQKIFQVPPSYFPISTIVAAKVVGTVSPAHDTPSCWQLLAEARQHIIDLQKQIIEMSKPNINAPKRTQQPA